jgi:ribosomal RNA-processing protein 12
LILNIKKRRESLKKRKLNPQTNEISTKTPDSTKKSFADTFHESGSELDSDGEDMDEDYIPDQFKEEMDTKRKTKSQTVIREGDVVDFLDKNVVSQVSHTRKSKQIKKTEFHTQDGKLVLENSDDKTAANNERNEDYYKQSLTSEVSFSRTADGRVKFNKRKRNADEDTGEIEVDPAVGKRWNASEGKKKQNIDTSKLLGRQYKAKKARGDVKRAGMPDPYAYIPLSGKIVGNMYFFI